MPQDKSPMEELNDGIQNIHTNVLNKMKEEWKSPGYVEDLGTQIAYAQFVKYWESHPLNEWPEHFEGHVHHVYIFYDSGTNENKRQIKMMQELCPITWVDCWWSSNRFGRHEFRIPIKPTEHEWKVYYGKAFDKSIEDIANEMNKKHEAGFRAIEGMTDVKVTTLEKKES